MRSIGRFAMILVTGMTLGISVVLAQGINSDGGLQPTTAGPSLKTVRFSGALQDGRGTPLTGTQGVTFALYSEQSGGAPLWLETQNVTADEQGRYSSLLGAMSSDGLPQDLFTSNQARWLGVRVNQPGAEEQPRVLLVSVPYALKAADAETLGGLPAAAFLLASDAVAARVASTGGLRASLLSDSLPTAAVSGTGTTNHLVKWTDGPSGTLGDTGVTELSGKIGIGATNPLFKLHVQLDEASDYLSLVVPRANEFDHGFLVRVARGPVSAPTATLNGDNIFNLYGQGHDGGGYYTAAAISMNVDGAVPVGGGIVPGNITFRTADNTGTVKERLRVDSSGNVGIGSTTPTQKLDVGGNVRATGNVIAGTQLCIASDCRSFWPAGGGSVTTIIPGTGISASPNPITTSGTLSIDTAVVPRLNNANTFVGSQTINGGNLALEHTTDGSSGVIRIGFSPFLHNHGDQNTFVGESAANFTMTGTRNNAFGYFALHNLTDGTDNTAVGNTTLFSDSDGSYNVAMGSGSLGNTTFGSGNTAIGYMALALNNVGANNVGIGYNAGHNPATPGNADTTGLDNTYIGANAGPGTSNQLTYATAIGANALVSASHSIVLGDGTVNVGIGIQAPTFTLDVRSGQINASGGLCMAGDCRTNWASATGLGGSGTANYLSKFTTGSALGNSQVYDNGTNVGIGTAAPTAKLHVNGNILSGDIQSTGTVTANAFVGDGSGLTNLPGGGSGIGGSGTVNIVPKFTAPTAVGNSRIVDDGMNLSMGDLTFGRLQILGNTTSPNMVGGFGGNAVTVGAIGGTVAGGGTAPDVFNNPCNNRVTDDFGTVSGGRCNRAGDNAGTTNDAFYATVGGGFFNIASGQRSTVAGGGNGTASGYSAVVSGGSNNTATGTNASVGGGFSNTASNYGATVSGGASNAASNIDTTVAGGLSNTASGLNSFVGGGFQNIAGGDYSIVGGGYQSQATSSWATVGGGLVNTATGLYATVGGGSGNSANGIKATIAGGGRTDDSNLVSGNRVTDDFGTVGGGGNNQAGDNAGTTSDRIGATVSGGENNTASGNFATVPGGQNNVALNDYAFAAGHRAKANHQGAFVWADSTDADFLSTANNQFLIRASGGVGIGTTNPAAALEVSGKVKVDAGIVAGGGIQHKRVSVGVVGSGSSISFVVSWDAPFADGNYTVAGSAEDSNTGNDSGCRLDKVASRTTTTVTVYVSNTYLTQSCSVNLIAIHD